MLWKWCASTRIRGVNGKELLESFRYCAREVVIGRMCTLRGVNDGQSAVLFLVTTSILQGFPCPLYYPMQELIAAYIQPIFLKILVAKFTFK